VLKIKKLYKNTISLNEASQMTLLHVEFYSNFNHCSNIPLTHEPLKESGFVYYQHYHYHPYCHDWPH